YEDVNVNLRNEDTEMVDADQGASEQRNVSQESGFEQVEEDAHVTITPVLDTQKADEPIQISEITSYFTTAIPPPPMFFNPLPQQTIPTPTPTTSEATTSFPSLPDFSSVFRFNNRVTNLEKDLSEIKQVDQYAQALSSIPAIVDRYMDNKLREAINKVVQAHNLDCRQEAQDDKNTYIELILPQAVSDFANPVIEKNVTESLEVVVLTRSPSQPKSTYEAAAPLSEFELTKILLDKIKESKSHLRADYKKKLYDALVESYNTDKDLFDSYGEVFLLKRTRDNKDKDQDPSAGSDQGTKRRKSNKDAESSRDSRQHVDSRPPETWISQVARAKEPRTSFDELMDTSFDFSAFVLNWLNIKDLTFAASMTSSKDVYSRKRIITVTRLLIMEKYDYGHLEEIEKLTNLTIDERYALNVALRMFTRRIVIQRRVEVLQLGVESYQKKLNLTMPDTFRSNLRNRTTYTAYSDPKGVIYKDRMNRNRLMLADELHKFSDGMLYDVRSALNDIAKGIRMECLSKRKWSGLDKRRARVMIQDIDKKLYERRLMQNLEKFVGGREYGNDLRLLERKI
ncbi:hypothetical protein Tco_1359219, partial [Tanacetum coccineum]